MKVYIYSLFIQGSHLAVWLIVLIGATLFLRREQGGGAISALLGAGIQVLTSVGYLLMTLLMTTGIFEPQVTSKIMMGLGIPGLVGAGLFAIGFLQLATALTREMPRDSS